MLFALLSGVEGRTKHKASRGPGSF